MATQTAKRPTSEGNGFGQLGDGEVDDQEIVEVKIAAPDRRILMVRIEGTTSLLTNKVSDHTIAKLKGKKFPKDQEPTPEQQYLSSIYRDEGGRPCFPSAGIRKAMITAGSGDDLKKAFFLRQYFTIEQELLPILGSEPQFREDTARNKNARNVLCIACRAEYRTPWGIVVPLRYNANATTRKKMLDLLSLTGFAVGIGCWRPEKNGSHGQWEVTECEELR